MGAVTEEILAQQLAKLKVELNASLEASLKQISESVAKDIKKFRDDLRKEFTESQTALESRYNAKLEELERKFEQNLKDETLKINLEIESKETALTKLINERCKEQSDRYDLLLKRVVQNEDHGRRLNLIIGGVKIHDDQTAENAIHQFFATKLDINRDVLNRFTYRGVHVLGKPKNNQIQPIIVAFQKQSHRDLIMQNAYKLKGFDDLFIRPNYSKETSLVRDGLMKTRRQLLTAGYKASVTERRYQPVLEILDEHTQQWKRQTDGDEISDD